MEPHNSLIIERLRLYVLPNSFFNEDKAECLFTIRRDVKARDAVDAVLAPQARVPDLNFPVTIDCAKWLFFAQVKFLIEELGEDRATALLRCGALDRSSFCISAREATPPPFLRFFWTAVPDTAPHVLVPGDILCLFGTQECVAKRPLSAWHGQSIGVVNEENSSIGFGEPESKDIAFWHTMLAKAGKAPRTKYEKVAHDVLTEAGIDPTQETQFLKKVPDNAVVLWSRLDPEQIAWAKTAPLHEVQIAMSMMTLSCRYKTSPELFKKDKVGAQLAASKAGEALRC